MDAHVSRITLSTARRWPLACRIPGVKGSWFAMRPV